MDSIDSVSGNIIAQIENFRWIVTGFVVGKNRTFVIGTVGIANFAAYFVTLGHDGYFSLNIFPDFEFKNFQRIEDHYMYAAYFDDTAEFRVHLKADVLIVPRLNRHIQVKCADFIVKYVTVLYAGFRPSYRKNTSVFYFDLYRKILTFYSCIVFYR